MPQLFICQGCAQPVESITAQGLCPTCAAAADSTPRPATSNGATVNGATEFNRGIGADLTPPAETRTFAGPAAVAELGTEQLTEHATPAAAPLPLPTPPPGYEFLRRLGSGGMGDVYLAREHPTERLVAMKLLRAPGNPMAAERFVSEVRALGRLRHPHIVQVLATDFLRQQPFFTMEYYSGGTVAERLRRSGPFAPREAARIIAVAARAVHAAHAAHILHRDIKPSNILLDEAGQPHLSDFGLAKLLDRDDGLTTVSGPLGTPSYMPPEQHCKMYGPIGPAADIYGLGATLYHMVTGQPPHGTGTVAEIVQRIERGVLPRPRSLRPDLPLTLEAIILKCLARRPADRYPTAAALAEDLERFLADQRPVAPLLTRWRSAGRWLGRRLSRLAPAAAVITLLGIATAIGMAIRPAASSTPDSEPPPDPMDAIHAKLRNGEQATLIGPHGMPVWHRVTLGPAAIAANPSHNNVCAFSAGDWGIIQLLPEVPLDRYILRAQIRITSIHGPSRFGYQSAGILVGYSRQPLELRPLHSGFTVHYIDFHYTPDQPLGHPYPEQAYLSYMAVSEHPNRNPDSVVTTSDYCEFIPSTTLPAPWREVEIHVAPDKLAAWWKETPDTWTVIAEFDRNRIRERCDNVQLTMKKFIPPLPGDVTDWNHRGGIALWSYHCGAEVRNLVIVPQPQP